MKQRKYIYWAILFNPIIVILYGIGCFYLHSLAKYGGISRRVPIILISFSFILIWFLYKYKIYQRFKQEENCTNKKMLQLEKISKVWILFAGIVLLFTTVVTGKNIYQSATNFQGKLAFFIHDLRFKREVEFVHNNLFENELDGLLQDIEETIPLPKELFVSSDFDLIANKDGQITSLDSFLYGKNDENETETFLISYESSKSTKVTIHLNGYADPAYNEEKKAAPLFKGLKVLPLKEAVSELSTESFGIYYEGYRNWGYNTDGILYFNEAGDTSQADSPIQEITGYTISLYAPQNDKIPPIRYVASSPKLHLTKEEEVSNTYTNHDAETYFIDENLGYQLIVTDAAAGSRFYALNMTVDGGKNWETIHHDPFSGSTGTASGIIFINEQLGFIGLSHSGGSYSDLYRTIDGAITFEKVDIPPVEVPLTDGETYNPFDFPEMPYKENGKLSLLIGQGQDGDYNGGSKALYQSVDHGETWEYVKEVF